MIRKYFQRLVISSLVLALFSLRFGNAIGGDGYTLHPLERAWKVTGLSLAGMTVEAWLHLDDRGRDRGELTALSNQLRDRLGLGQEVEMSAGESDGVGYAAFSGIQKNGSVVSGTLYSARTGGTQLSIYGVKRGGIRNIRSYLRDLVQPLAEFGVQIDWAVLLEGSRTGMISERVLKELTAKVLLELEGEWVETQWTSEGSVTKAYTTFLGEAADRYARGVNLIISTLYDAALNTTEVTLATPMLNQ